RDLTQALANIPGVTVNNYSNGVGYLESSVLLINGTEKIVVVIDGVRANVNGSTFNVFSSAGFLSMDQIERIEVLKGSASTLYGADAKGGVINIITKKPNENKSALTVEAGSFSKQRYALSTQGKNKDTSWSFSYQKDKSGDFTAGNGVTIPSYLDADAFSLKLNHKLNEKVKNQLTLFMRRQNTDVTSSSRWMMKLGSWGIQDQLTVQAGKKHLLIGGYDMFEDQIFDYNDTYTTYKDKSITNQAVFFQDEWSFDQYWKLTSG
ncbi:TonB-dependent receptor, partial [bacterium]|nr:TonB-dependent receptor [bacterium]